MKQAPASPKSMARDRKLDLGLPTIDDLAAIGRQGVYRLLCHREWPAIREIVTYSFAAPVTTIRLLLVWAVKEIRRGFQPVIWPGSHTAIGAFAATLCDNLSRSPAVNCRAIVPFAAAFG
jgi:hypothetical protein